MKEKLSTPKNVSLANEKKTSATTSVAVGPSAWYCANRSSSVRREPVFSWSDERSSVDSAVPVGVIGFAQTVANELYGVHPHVLAPRRTPRLADVAATAGVSITTVSHVVNGTRFVAHDTRYRVEQVLRGLRYVSPQTSRPRAGKSAVGLAITGASNPYVGELI